MGHDLGGILIKQVLFQTMASADPKHKDTLDAIFAIVFFGTPHQGPAHIPRPVAGFKKFAEDLKKSFGITGMPSDLMAALQTAGMFDLGLEDSWHAQKGRYRFLSVCETMNAVSQNPNQYLYGLTTNEFLRLYRDHLRLLVWNLSRRLCLRWWLIIRASVGLTPMIILPEVTWMICCYICRNFAGRT
jgi:hypothetical protein